jgi:hypothetical protein
MQKFPVLSLFNREFDAESSSHHAGDTTIVRRLESSIDSGRPETTARRLEQTYASEKALEWIPGHTNDIAWESNQIAQQAGALRSRA